MILINRTELETDHEHYLRPCFICLIMLLVALCLLRSHKSCMRNISTYHAYISHCVGFSGLNSPVHDCVHMDNIKINISGGLDMHACISIMSCLPLWMYGIYSVCVNKCVGRPNGEVMHSYLLAYMCYMYYYMEGKEVSIRNYIILKLL